MQADFASSPAVPLSPPSSPNIKPARFRRRDFLLGSGALIALAALAGFQPPAGEAASSLDDFMLVSQTVSGGPLDRQAGLRCFRALQDADARFVDHIQTLAWLIRRHPRLDSAGLISLLDAEPDAGPQVADHAELRATLGRLVDVWTAQVGATPALADARALIERLPDDRAPNT